MAKKEVHAVLSRLGTRVRQLRDDKGWKQRELAERADVSTKRLGELERGVPNAEIMTAIKVADALDVPVYSLFAPENLIPASADPRLIRNFEIAREAVSVLGESMGIPPPVRHRSPDAPYERRRKRRQGTV